MRQVDKNKSYVIYTTLFQDVNTLLFKKVFSDKKENNHAKIKTKLSVKL